MKQLRRWKIDFPEVFAVGFWAFWWLMVLLFGSHDDTWWPTLRNVGLLTVALTALVVLTRGRGPLVLLGTRAVAVILYFGVGHSLTGEIAHDLCVPTIERRLAQMEHFLFDGYLTEKLQAFNHPGLVEWLQVNYLCFLLLPLPLFFVLVGRKRYEEAGEYASLCALAVLVCFTGYILLPATTPALLFQRLGDAAPIQFDGPLHGLWLTDGIQHLLLKATSNRNDAFPSGHTTVAVMVLLSAYRMERRVFWWILPTGVSIVYSTLALRYHFAIDVMCGLCLGWALPWANRRLNDWWRTSDFRSGLAVEVDHSA